MSITVTVITVIEVQLVDSAEAVVRTSVSVADRDCLQSSANNCSGFCRRNFMSGASADVRVHKGVFYSQVVCTHSNGIASKET